MISVLTASPESVPTAATYLSFPDCGVRGNDFYAYTPVAAPGTYRNWTLTLGTAPGTGITWTFTVYLLNGSTAPPGTASALTITISGTNTTGEDTTHDLAVVQGDNLALRVEVSGGSPADPVTLQSAVEFEGTAARTSMCSPEMCQVDPSAPSYSSPFTTAQNTSQIWHATEGPATAVVPIACVFTGTTMKTPAADFGGRGYTITYIKNGVEQDGAGGTVDTRQTVLGTTLSASTTFSLSFAQGDTVALKATPVASPLGNQVAVSTAIQATTDREWIVAAFTFGSPDNGVASFNRIHGGFRQSGNWPTTEGAATQNITTSRLYTLDRLYVRLSTAPGSGKSYTFDGRLNSTSPGGTLSVTVADAATTGSDLSNALALTATTDVLGMRAVPSGTPASASVLYTMRAVSGAAVTYDPGAVIITGTAMTSLVIGDGFRIIIDGVDQTHRMIEKEGRRAFKLDLRLGANWTATLPIYDNDSTASAYRPDVDADLTAFYFGQQLFHGVITNVRDTPRARTDKGVITAITAKAGLMVTDQIEVNNSSFNAGQTLKQALTALRDQNNPGLWSFSVIMDPGMADGPTLEMVTFDMVLMQEAFNRLMDRTGWIIRIRPDLVLEAFEVGDKVCSYALTATNLLALESVTWEKTSNRQKRVNRVHVRYNDGADVVTVDDLADIGTSNIWERTYLRPSITDVDEATEEATGLLRVGIETPKEITLRTKQYPMPLPGDVINLSFPNRLIPDDDYLITRVQAEDYMDGKLEFVVTCVSGTEPKRVWLDLFRHAVSN